MTVETTKGLLPLNLQFFAEGSEGGSEVTETTTQEETTNQEETTQDENMIPKSRFDEVNKEMKELRESVKQFQEEKEAKEKEEAKRQKEEQEKKGEFEKLYRDKEAEVEELATFKERAESLEGVINGMVEAKLEAIPEDYHDIIPTNLSPEQKLEWINKAESKGMFGTKEDKTEVTIGESTNHSDEARRDVSKMSPMERLLSGYTKR